MTKPVPGTEFFAIDYQDAMGPACARLPYSLRVMAENVVRQAPDSEPNSNFAHHIAQRDGQAVPFRPSRLLLQDMLGLPLLVDMMAMRSRDRKSVV